MALHTRATKAQELQTSAIRISFPTILPKQLRGKRGLPQRLRSKESACYAGDVGSISGLRRSPGEGNGNPLQYSCLENPMDRGAWRDTIHRVAKSETQLK